MRTPEQSDILYGLETARTKDDVRHLVLQHGYDKVSEQWQNLPVVQRGALSLVRNFDAVIIHELSEPANGSADLF